MAGSSREIQTRQVESASEERFFITGEGAHSKAHKDLLLCRKGDS